MPIVLNTQTDVKRKMIGDYVTGRQVAIINPQVTCKALLDIFRQQPEMPCVLVENQVGDILGIIMRESYNRHLAGRFAAALFYDKPAAEFVDRTALMVETTAAAEDILDQALQRPDANFYDCIILLGAQPPSVLTLRDVMQVAQLLQQEADGSRKQTVQRSYHQVQHIQGNVEQVSSEARQSMEHSQAMEQAAQHGMKKLGEVQECYREVMEQLEKQHTQALSMSNHLEVISGIAKAVKDLAGQSTLLAINASIEAAHAGVYGRGFQVVSQEVRGLAAQTQDCSSRITKLLDEIGELVRGQTDLTSEGLRQVANGSKFVDEGNEALASIIQAVQRMEQLNQDMTQAAEQARLTAGQVADELMQMNRSAADVSSSAEDTGIQQAQPVEEQRNVSTDDNKAKRTAVSAQPIGRADERTSKRTSGQASKDADEVTSKDTNKDASEETVEESGEKVSKEVNGLADLQVEEKKDCTTSEDTNKNSDKKQSEERELALILH
ncbi:methyl-accepting chemotaxis protein [Paenibacillus massiliensis]|uniref:methyl-accepting chemotaxis protein n=1 Tax=Paenibacillus massiliensis TaxID=225917 RepID=UPI000379825C|nr:methyl-accepting chemotaxis protein [Paenibacillus massiliensis]